jgi:tRNA1(Val) A37 N6-methylase TrmN6
LLAFLKTFERRVIKPQLRRLKPRRYVTYGDIRVNYRDHLDGGGRTFGMDYLPLFHDLGVPRQARIFEWCAGPGFIGFALLGHGFCETLCLADINPEAVETSRRTVAENGLAERVAVYRSDNLAGIPASERWDLVVGNPPHFSDLSPGELRFHDERWSLHREFFAAIGNFLKPGGMIVLVENNHGSIAESFRHMIEDAGLCIVFVHNCEGRRTPYNRFYYMGIARRGDSVPVWALAAGQYPINSQVTRS